MFQKDEQLVQGFMGLLEALPDDLRVQIFESYFKNHKKELEDFAFYLSCKEEEKEGFLSKEESLKLLDNLSQYSAN